VHPRAATQGVALDHTPCRGELQSHHVSHGPGATGHMATSDLTSLLR
jgi:hypothetical protein